MTDKLPPNLLALFAPRPPLRYLPHCDHEPAKRRTMPISGVAAFLEELRKPDPDYVPTESWLQRRDRLQLEKKERQEKKIKEGLENCESHRISYIICALGLYFFFCEKQQRANARYLQTSRKMTRRFVVIRTRRCFWPD
jgi:hypothetical protein